MCVRFLRPVWLDGSRRAGVLSPACGRDPDFVFQRAKFGFSVLRLYVPICSNLKDLSGHALRINDAAFKQHEDLRRPRGDIIDLKQRISGQARLVQELACKAQDTASAEKVLHQMQEALRDWCAHRELIIKLQAAQPKPA